ncbi:phosphatase PAP2 family protein [Pontibacter qinzhouensis]|uniref:Phosphatase PAP2 family protein n=1 Tax=Pontibacter qinzhouensis TaxID=2603253 RepID=A0A5C8KDS4_9BACT|nr:phosphatase PAP2 family protein [Pontibacter qinzhouensis]TXK52071.1 phosphatase PAP2 family protein [Pontibacter qinzhouensis]
MIRSFYKKIVAALALFTLELFFAWGLFLVCIILFLYVSKQVVEGGNLNFDTAAFNFADSIANTGLTDFIEVITFFGSRQFLTPAALLLIAYFLFIRKHRWYSLKVPVVALGSITLNLVLKYLFDRPRPALPHLVHASGLSFPSGHSMVAASFYGLLIYLAWKHIETPIWRYTVVGLLTLLIMLIGFSRIYLHVHYATDVLAGFAAGFMWVIIGLWSLRKIERFSKKELTPVIEE